MLEFSIHSDGSHQGIYYITVWLLLLYLVANFFSFCNIYDQMWLLRMLSERSVFANCICGVRVTEHDFRIVIFAIVFFANVVLLNCVLYFTMLLDIILLFSVWCGRCLRSLLTPICLYILFLNISSRGTNDGA